MSWRKAFFYAAVACAVAQMISMVLAVAEKDWPRAVFWLIALNATVYWETRFTKETRK